MKKYAGQKAAIELTQRKKGSVDPCPSLDCRRRSCFVSLWAEHREGQGQLHDCSAYSFLCGEPAVSLSVMSSLAACRQR